MSFTSEATASSNLDLQTITITNTGAATSGPVDTVSATDLTEPGHPTSGNWLVGSDDCEGTSLAPGQSCHVDLAFQGGTYDDRSWTGDFVAQATPGGVKHVSVNVHVTSKLVLASFAELDATPTVDASTHVVITNASASAIGPMHASITFPGISGTWQLLSDSGFAVPACTQDMTLAAGESCQWQVSYHNATGGGADGSGLHLDAGSVQATTGLMGFGKP
jgi:hypothetical protein